MAVLAIRHVGEGLLAGEPQRARIGLVAEAERRRGRWRPITSVEPRPYTALRELAAIDAAARNPNLPLKTRVALVTTWILAGEEPAAYG